MNAIDQPLQFVPILKRKIWGGRRLATVLGKALPPTGAFGESWELSDCGDDASVVADGPLAGTTVRDLFAHHPDVVLGRTAGTHDRFPLLVKFIDAHQDLSVQVHPDDATAAALHPGQWGKTECWVVVHADPGATLCCGLQPGVGRGDLERALREGTVDACLHRIAARAGDCVLIRAGTVHTIGAGLVIAEIQQTSDLTFRLSDWNRVDAQGRSRPLHVAESLRSIDFSRGPIDVVQARRCDDPCASREHLIACDYFTLDRWHVTTRADLPACPARARILMVLEGCGALGYNGGRTCDVSVGRTLLVPTGVADLTLQAHTPLVVLDVRAI